LDKFRKMTKKVKKDKIRKKMSGIYENIGILAQE
jgi:hypothetical protein